MRLKDGKLNSYQPLNPDVMALGNAVLVKIDDLPRAQWWPLSAVRD